VQGHPRILSVATAMPQYHVTQEQALRCALGTVVNLGAGPDEDVAALEHQMNRLFHASGVAYRQFAVDIWEYYRRPRGTGERMTTYLEEAPLLGERALAQSLELAERNGSELTDLVTVSCTGYGAPGIDVNIARALELPRDVRRVLVGHMGCFGALAGLRQCVASVRAYPDALAAMVSVELSSLHLVPTRDTESLTSFSLFGDAAAGLVLGAGEGVGPEVVDTYCVSSYENAAQMSWRITDAGFVMGLSPRVPVTLGRQIGGVVARLLSRNGLQTRDVARWIVHPGGPSILEAVQRKLELSAEQMAPSWDVLRDHGNCSSATVLIILERLLGEHTPRRGEWGVMMAFGPGLTLETCLLRF
jgi:predicted naringenin-chalcone synthase